MKESIIFRRGKTTFLFIAFIILLIILFSLDIAIGSVNIPLVDVLESFFSQKESSFQKIVFLFRLPKAITALFAGGALSLCGLMMQNLFRNPLAGPSVLGITSGASIGVAAVLLTSGFSTTNYIITQMDLDFSLFIFLSASLGAAFIMLLILFIASRIQDNIILLLVGIMIGNIALSVISIWQYFARPEQIQDFLFWTLGSLSGVNENKLVLLSIVVSVISVLIFLYSNQLNLLLTGRNYAISMGLNYQSTRMFIIISSALLTGVITGFCGPIGFIGIAVPHLARSIFNTSNHRILIPACILIGAMLLLLCDLVAHLPGSQYVLPINAVTALVGSPIVIWVIIKNRNLHSTF